ncbi:MULTISPECIES: phosphate/phosphite/phosphonate ABC transporter substrate-binding protein [Bacillaceae]|uniref:phosphate/phosphite/phosphonate ABC transporter substrate-binding protein n=1 Tax=Bacillaceae TaxID=186817 RepID=UPI001E332B5C|nr:MULTISPECIES: phosphate/phosphite/phosphonate ABC transporter substrate-binding protein [Bacillaceae]MCE4048538.1 phosphate/phosphite/phosphonate ABC transporter substrate-binding protein [Bacillus sp. Au-Bac7]MCM3029211.1 phosphate/phosphite/phosphonate ABC transporter substrate-binding protein [Niallia sp. MER 6]MDL0434902.1 phosphate/phosphite/phosphonate ABC transporter substrate-binding protein [Niallia sp. SS-2023]UPO88715.1 phosphate/phosphite/phosphonate ABC transporter substrate-bin
MFKKIATFGLSLSLAAGVLAGCGSSNETGSNASEGYEPKELTVQFVPSQSADTLEAKAKPLEDLLSDELGIPVKVSVSTNYNTIIEAMASKQVDVGFLPPTAYVLAKEKDAADVILQAQRKGINDDGSEKDELVDFYKSIFVVKNDSGIDSVADLKDKKIAFQDVTSSAGYVWPAATLMDNDLDPLKDVQGITVKGHDQAIISLLNGDVDAAAVFQDARNIVKADFPTVFEDTKVISFTEEIPNDTVSVRSDMTDEWKKKLQDAFIAIGKSDEGHEIIREIYTHEGYVVSDDSNFDVVREYAEKVKTE